MVLDMEQLITIREAARQCHRSAETVRRWVWGGKLHAEKVGNQLFVRRADLLRACEGTPKDRDARLALLDEIDAIRQRIRQHIGGDLDIVKVLDESREAHPRW